MNFDGCSISQAGLLERQLTSEESEERSWLKVTVQKKFIWGLLACHLEFTQRHHS